MSNAVHTLKAGLQRPLLAGVHQQLPEFRVSIVIPAPVLAAPAEKRIQHIDRNSCRLRRRLGSIVTVGESNFMNRGLGENRNLSELQIGAAVMPFRRAGFEIEISDSLIRGIGLQEVE